MITLDSTSELVNVFCSECSWWHAAAWTKTEAWAAGARHQAAEHSGDRQAEMAHRMSASRNK